MSNSIDIVMRDSNSMPSLNFTWIAVFKDGTKLEQIENNIEDKFQFVIDRINELAYFNLTDKKEHLFTVDLLNGLIGFNSLLLPDKESKEQKENIRLIYFRRNTVTFGTDLIKKEHLIKYHLGYQYLDKHLNNRKIIFIIDNEGNWVIEE